MAVELKDIQENRDSLIQKYDLLKKIARNDCYLIKDFAVAMKMLIFSENSPYKANLTEEQANLIKSIINIAKENGQKPAFVSEKDCKCVDFQ